MNIPNELKKAFRLYRRTFNISDAARVLFLFKTPQGFSECGAVTDYFFIKQEEDTDGKNVVYLKILNNPANLALLEETSLVVIQNFNPVYDGLIFNLNKLSEVDSSLLTIRRRLNPTPNTYTPPPPPAP